MTSTAPASLAIRRLRDGDEVLAEALNALFGQVFEDDETYGGQPPGKTYLARLLSDDRVIALVAEDDGMLVGGLVAYILPKLEQARSEAYLYDLGVITTHRRRGVASALIEALKQHAGAAGAWVIFVQADLADDPAIALYTKLGVREDVLHFDIAVWAAG